jgi:uncharacterized phage protein (TIGR02218 family)
MSRRMNTALVTHLQGQVTTTCELLRLRLDDGRLFGVTSLDKDIFYDNTWFRCITGLDSSVHKTDTDLSVDNSEVSMLLRAMGQDGLTFDQIQSGVLDDGRYEFFIINYESPSQAHMLDAGDVGEVRVVNQHGVTMELLSYAVRLRQSIGGVDSIRCRAVFGTFPDQQKGCGVNADVMWVDGVVTGVGGEQRRVFADNSVPLAEQANTYRVRFTSGRNKSTRLYQVEAYSLVSGTIALIEPVRFDIKVGDTFQVRPDCNKLPDDCKKYSNFINYKGEPYIPVADGLEGATPSAQLASGVTGGAKIED